MDPFDLAALVASRDALNALDTGGAPTLRPLWRAPEGGSIALLPGSFNPPTAAHVLLAERALREGVDGVGFVLARETVGKEQTGLTPEDRLLALSSACAGNPFFVAVASHGLYADLAEAAARAFPAAALTFLLGSDKVIQIFEDAWYDDRDAALERLFARATLLCAPRANDGERLRAVLEEPRNRRWAGRVRVLRLHPCVGELSSTHVRGLLRAGADPAALVPPAVASILSATRAFSPPVVLDAEEVDAYDVRARLVQLLRDHASEADLRAATDAVLSDDARGRRMRALLRDARDPSRRELLDLVLRAARAPA